MHTSVTTVVLSVLLSVGTAAGAVFVITGLFLDPNGTDLGREAPPPAGKVDEAEPVEEDEQALEVQSETERQLKRRVNALEKRLGELTERHQSAAREIEAAMVERDELRRALAQVQRGGPSVAVDGEQAETDTEWLAERFAAHAEVSQLLESEEFEEAFRETLEKIEEERRNQEIEERLERMERANERTYQAYLDTVTEEVGLTPTQRSNVEGLLEERAQAMLRLYDSRIPRDERGNWREIHSGFDERLQTILSPQQYQLYEENGLGDFRRYQRRGRGGGGSND